MTADKASRRRSRRTGAPAAGAGRSTAHSSSGSSGQDQAWTLTLYVNGASSNSVSAIENIHRICDGELKGRVDLRIVDVRAEPALLVRDQVIATPTLVRSMPEPLRRIVGNLSDTARLRESLDLRPSRGGTDVAEGAARDDGADG